MKKIPLTKGQFAIVDDEDYEWLNERSWCYSHGYALRGTNSGKRIYMHREINNTPEGLETDHINRDKLDNRRSNLRTANRSMNSANHSAHRHNITGIKGVVLDKRTRLYRAQIGVDGKRIHLGYFKDVEQAKQARGKAEKIYHAV